MGLRTNAYPWLPRVLASLVDWAPILLSRELTNTEYGQILNMTDQMLKSWSNSNSVIYGNFPYPTPLGNPDPRGIRARLALQFGQPVQPPMASRNLKHALWRQAETT